MTAPTTSVIVFGGGQSGLTAARDEVADYLQRYAQHQDLDIRTHTKVSAVEADGTSGVD